MFIIFMVLSTMSDSTAFLSPFKLVSFVGLWSDFTCIQEKKPFTQCIYYTSCNIRFNDSLISFQVLCFPMLHKIFLKVFFKAMQLNCWGSKRVTEPFTHCKTLSVLYWEKPAGDIAVLPGPGYTGPSVVGTVSSSRMFCTFLSKVGSPVKSCTTSTRPGSLVMTCSWFLSTFLAPTPRGWILVEEITLAGLLTSSWDWSPRMTTRCWGTPSSILLPADLMK